MEGFRHNDLGMSESIWGLNFVYLTLLIYLLLPNLLYYTLVIVLGCPNLSNLQPLTNEISYHLGVPMPTHACAQIVA